MRMATRIIPAGLWDRQQAAVGVTLRWQDRQRRRFRLVDDQGEPFLLNLARPGQMADGDGLVLEDGAILAVTAAAEEVLEVALPSATLLARIAWHLGNRHLPVMILPAADGEALRLRLMQDHVIEEMLQQLGAAPQRVLAPFHPEAGAYAGQHSHGHGHGHGHDHDRDHDHGGGLHG